MYFVSNLGKPSQIRLDDPLAIPLYQLSFPPELQKAYLRFNNLILSLGKCPASDACPSGRCTHGAPNSLSNQKIVGTSLSDLQWLLTPNILNTLFERFEIR
jgi:hypothetical protein